MSELCKHALAIALAEEIFENLTHGDCCLDENEIEDVVNFAFKEAKPNNNSTEATNNFTRTLRANLQNLAEDMGY